MRCGGARLGGVEGHVKEVWRGTLRRCGGAREGGVEWHGMEVCRGTRRGVWRVGTCGPVVLRGSLRGLWVNGKREERGLCMGEVGCGGGGGDLIIM
jgi:hypothetical protein